MLATAAFAAPLGFVVWTVPSSRVYSNRMPAVQSLHLPLFGGLALDYLIMRCRLPRIWQEITGGLLPWQPLVESRIKNTVLILLI